MIKFDDALALVIEAARPTGVETVWLRDAAGRVLAHEVRSRVDAPPYDASAMDGYAVRDADLFTLPARLRVVGRSSAGDRHGNALVAGECRRIFTGAPVPAGADRVVVQEAVDLDGDVALFSNAPTVRHVRLRASDFAAGDVILRAGCRLSPYALVAAAGADVDRLEVWRRPVVSVISTGSELVEPGRAAGSPGFIPESVSLGIAALVNDWGATVLQGQCLPDNLGMMKNAASACLEFADLIVVTGGASVGDKDYAKRMFDDAGLTLIFSKIAMKPGKPVWFGRARGRLVMGLPGNPSSALVIARLLLAPLLAGMTGREPMSALRWRRAPLANEAEPCGERETFVQARWFGEAALILSNQDSSAQRSLAQAELLVRRPPFAPRSEIGDLAELIEL